MSICEHLHSLISRLKCYAALRRVLSRDSCPSPTSRVVTTALAPGFPLRLEIIMIMSWRLHRLKTNTRFADVQALLCTHSCVPNIPFTFMLFFWLWADDATCEWNNLRQHIQQWGRGQRRNIWGVYSVKERSWRDLAAAPRWPGFVQMGEVCIWLGTVAVI